jgi:hypothetical protein
MAEVLGLTLAKINGTFHVDASTARLLRATGDFAVAGTKINGQGFRCNDCGFVALYSDHCGRCDGTDLTRED